MVGEKQHGVDNDDGDDGDDDESVVNKRQQLVESDIAEKQLARQEEGDKTKQVKQEEMEFKITNKKNIRQARIACLVRSNKLKKKLFQNPTIREGRRVNFPSF